MTINPMITPDPVRWSRYDAANNASITHSGLFRIIVDDTCFFGLPNRSISQIKKRNQTVGFAQNLQDLVPLRGDVQ
jgi:hypothetical protein